MYTNNSECIEFWEKIIRIAFSPYASWKISCSNIFQYLNWKYLRKIRARCAIFSQWTFNSKNSYRLLTYTLLKWNIRIVSCWCYLYFRFFFFLFLPSFNRKWTSVHWQSRGRFIRKHERNTVVARLLLISFQT